MADSDERIEIWLHRRVTIYDLNGLIRSVFPPGRYSAVVRVAPGETEPFITVDAKDQGIRRYIFAESFRILSPLELLAMEANAQAVGPQTGDCQTDDYRMATALNTAAHLTLVMPRPQL